MSKIGRRGGVGALENYFREFGALKECGREFWVVQLINLLDGAAYFAMLTVSTLYLSETLGYSDTEAGNLWGLTMAVYTAVGVVAGFIGDSLGIKRTLHISVVILVVSRLAMSFTTAKAVVIPSLFLIMVGTAIMTPILIAATKRYTNPKTQSAGFSLLYLVMNAGGFLGNILLDPMRGSEWGNRTVFMLGSVLSILCWLSILFFWRRGLAKVDERQQADRAENGHADESRSNEGEEQQKWEAPWTIALSVMRESAFWRFMLFLVLVVGVKLVFEHQNQVYPKYYQRTMAESVFQMSADSLDTLADGTPAGDESSAAPNSKVAVPPQLIDAFAAHDLPLSASAKLVVDEAEKRWRVRDVKADNTYVILRTDDALSVYIANVPIGKLASINSFIICIGLIISAPIVARYNLFNVMFFGISVSAVSMVVLAIYPGWFIGMFGLTMSQGYMVLAICQIAIFSFGEVIWSPRLYEYTAAIAPEGREASYMGLSYAPILLARLGEGPLAGNLLNKYCPPDVTERLATVSYVDSPQFMNVILACIALATPILILVFRGVIQKESRLDQQAEEAANVA